MTDPAVPTPDSPTTPPPTAPPPKRKRRWLRRLLALGVVLIVGLIVLVALLPTLLSTSAGRSFALGRVQGFVPNGRLDVADWSFGWFSPIKLTGVKLYDDKGNAVIEADEVSTDLTLAKAARQNFDLGNVVVDAAGHVVIYPNGTTNLQHVLTDANAPKPATKPHAERPSDTKLPDVRGKITLRLKGDARLVDSGDATVGVVRLLPGSGGTIDITDINQPISTDLKFAYDAGDNTKAGSVIVKSSVDAVDDNTLIASDVARVSASVDLTLADVDAGALRPFLALTPLKPYTIAGVARGTVVGELKPGQSGGIKGVITVADVSLAGPQLLDTYRAASIDVPIGVTRDAAAGASRLKLDAGVTSPELNIRVTGDVAEAALAKLADKQMPGDAGAVGVSLDADLKKLIAALPKTTRLPPGTTIDRGAFAAGVTLTLGPAGIQSHVKTDLTLAGTRDGRPVAVDPVTFTADATLTRLDDPAAGLADLNASFTSAFARFQGGGKTVTTLKGDGRADFAKAREQAVQFTTALDDTRLAGTATFDLSSDARADDASRVATTFNATIDGLDVVLKGRPPIKLNTAKLVSTADLVLDPATLSLERIAKATADVFAGEDAQRQLVNLSAVATNVDTAAKTIETLSVSKLSVPSFQRLQPFVDPFVPALREQKIELAGGALNASLDAKAIDIANVAVVLSKLDAAIPGLRVRRDGRDVFADDVTVSLAANVAKSGGGTSVDVGTLLVKSALATLEKADGPLKIDLQGGLPRGTGAVTTSLDAVKANALARTLSPDAKVPQVTSGKFGGTLTMDAPAGRDATVKFVGTMDGLTLADTPVRNDTYAIDLTAIVPSAFDRLRAGLLVRNDNVNVTARDVAVRMPAAGVAVQQLVENAAVDVGVKDLDKAAAVVSALVPGLKLPLKPAGAMTVKVTAKGGTATIDLDASRLVVTNAAGQSFAFDPAKPVTLKLAATVEGYKAVDGVRVTELGGDLDVAQLSLAEPIVIRNLTTTPTAQGKLTVSGGLDRLLPLLAVVQQAEKPMPYAGRYSFTQSVAPKNGAIGLVGNGTVDDFAVLDDRGQATFRESQVSIGNDLAVDLTRQVATITSLSLDMASSKAATVNVNGGVEKWADERRLKNVVVKVDAVGEKIWPILYGMMKPEQQAKLKDAKLTGPIRIDLTANGAYPAKPTWNESVRTVVAYGGVSVKGVDALGLTVSDFALPVSVYDDGKLATGDTRKRGAARFAKPFTVNEGRGDFGSIVVDIGNPDLPLSIGRKQKLLQEVRINPVMAKQLGSLASVIFKDAEDATGLLDLTSIECQNVPLADLMDNRGTASFVYSVKKLELKGPVPSAIVRGLDWGDGGLVGDITDATLSLKGGVAYQDMTLALERQNTKALKAKKGKTREAAEADEPQTVEETMKFKGGIDLGENRFKDYTLTLSSGLLIKDVRKRFPDGATLNLRGAVNDVGGALVKAIGELAVKGVADDAIDKALGGLRKKLERDKGK